MAEANSNHEVGILQLISSSPNHRGKEHIVQLLDSFSIEGPNGKHRCLVLELLGPNIPDLVGSYLHDERLPAQAARSIACQVLTGVDFLAQLNIGHGGKLIPLTHKANTKMSRIASYTVNSLTELAASFFPDMKLLTLILRYSCTEYNVKTTSTPRLAKRARIHKHARAA